MVPEISLSLPRPVTSLHQIEITSKCSLSCSYCIWPKLGRAKHDMTMETYVEVLRHVDFFVNQELSQGEVNLAGIGESTLHPNFVEMVKKARHLIGRSTFLTFATNGTEWDEDLAKALAPYMSQSEGFQPGVFVSLHRPEKAKKAVDLCRKYGLLAGVSNDPALNTIDWAGQVPFTVTAPTDRPCPWIRQGRVIAFSSGKVGSCCMDGGENSVIGHVNDPVGTWKTQPWSLCESCDQQVGVKGYNQYPSGGRKLPVRK